MEAVELDEVKSGRGFLDMTGEDIGKSQYSTKVQNS
jgi:hypothetical protein